VVVYQESLHIDDLRLFCRDSRLELTEDSEVAELKVWADLEGEGSL
jgi:hypothetical protein